MSKKDKVKLEMSKKMKSKEVFGSAEEEVLKTSDFVNGSLFDFLNLAEEKGFNTRLTLTIMFIHATAGIYYGSRNSIEVVKAELNEELDNFFEIIDNNGKSVKSIH